MTNDTVGGMVEAIAWWRLDLPDRRRVLIQAAVDLLMSGIGGPAVSEMASLYSDADGFQIDQSIEQVAHELGISSDLSRESNLIVLPRMCRLVLAGALSEREFSRWAHSEFHHESDVELLNDLALLDDDYDDAVDAQKDTASIRARIRDLAHEILALP